MNDIRRYINLLESNSLDLDHLKTTGRQLWVHKNGTTAPTGYPLYEEVLKHLPGIKTKLDSFEDKLNDEHTEWLEANKDEEFLDDYWADLERIDFVNKEIYPEIIGNGWALISSYKRKNKRLFEIFCADENRDHFKNQVSNFNIPNIEISFVKKP